MAKYRFDAKMHLLIWLMSRSPSVADSDLLRIRPGADSKLLSNLVYRPMHVASIEDRRVPGQEGQIPVRIYRPPSDRDLPVIVFFHGGGWAIGGLEGHDAICRRLATENRALVVAVAYRLAPDHKYPAAVEDSYDATCWVAEHAAELGASADKVIVMGDSAGGNLAAVVCLMARDQSGPHIAFQVLIYPAVDLAHSFPSKELYDDTPVLDRKSLTFYRDLYVSSPADLTDAYVSPLLASDHRNLPPALILTGEYDPLRDEGKAYAEKLRAAGNDVRYVCFPGMVHGFLSFGWLASATPHAFAQIRQALQRFRAARVG